jgi:hypothetical protein
MMAGFTGSTREGHQPGRVEILQGLDVELSQDLLAKFGLRSQTWISHWRKSTGRPRQLPFRRAGGRPDQSFPKTSIAPPSL